MDEIKQARKTFSRIGLAYFIYLAIALSVQFLILLALKAVGVSGDVLSPGTRIVILSAIPMYCFGFPVCVLLLKRVPVIARTGDERWGIDRLVVCFIAGISVMYMGNLIGQLLMQLIGLFFESGADNSTIDLVMNSNILVNLIVVAILAPMIEELLFRKMLIDRICQYGQAASVLISGFAFGMIHGNFYQFFYAFGLGLIFAYIYVKTGKIWYTITMHMIINFMSSVVLTSVYKGMDLQALETATVASPRELYELMLEYGPSLMFLGSYVLVMLGATVAGIALMFCYRRQMSFAPGLTPVPRGRRFTSMFLNLGMILFFAMCVFLFVMS